jgi:hypothetical protein
MDGEMCYASSQGRLPIVVDRSQNLDKAEANVDKIILLVRSTVTVKLRWLI